MVVKDFIVILHASTYDGLQDKVDSFLEAVVDIEVVSFQYQDGPEGVSIALHYRSDSDEQ